MATKRKIGFRNWLCEAHLAKYGNGRTAIQLFAYGEGPGGIPIAKATVNIPEYDLPEGFVIIKDWQENEGMLAALEQAGIVQDSGQRVMTGFVQAAVCKLLVDPKFVGAL
jgi:hypothetical protein